MPDNFSIAKKFGELLKEYMAKDEHFYLFSPDETTSNKLDAVYDVASRAWNLPQESWDLPEAEDGHIVELLSENALFAMMCGHILNGEPAMMTSYESFFSVANSQILQQIKFFKQSNAVSWRPKYPAVNLLSTSVCWRQDHNGFSHQSPALISTLLALPSNLANCLFPLDDVSAEVMFDFMLNSTNVVNLTTFDKNPLPRYINKSQAEDALKNGGALILDDFSDENPEIVFVSAGDIVTREAAKAIEILRADLPDLKVRLVNILALSYNTIGTTENKLSLEQSSKLFGEQIPVIANFHGYPETLRSILGSYIETDRLSVHGFMEEGSTTTPFEMLALNGASRYDLAADAAEKLGRADLAEKCRKAIKDNHEYAIKNGIDKIEM